MPSLISTLPLLASVLWGMTSVAAEKAYFVEWEGNAGASYYELQASKDKSFSTENTFTDKLRSPSGIVRPSLPDVRFFRMRAVYGKRPGKWIPLRPGKWPVPIMDETFRVPKHRNDQFEIDWDRPDSALDGDFRYRVRLSPWKSETVLFDAYSDSESFVLPPLPGGNYVLSVEPTGIPTLGTIAPQGVTYRSALVEVEAIDYDPENPNPSRTILETYSLHDPSFRGELSYRQSLRQSILEPSISMQFDSGFTFAFGVPFVVWDRDASPRVGGDPYVPLTFARKILGNPLRHFGWRLDVELPIDTRKRSLFSIDRPFDLTTEFYLLWTWNNTWQMNLNLGAGVHTPALRAPARLPYQEFAYVGGQLRWKTPYELLSAHGGLEYQWNAAIDIEALGYQAPVHRLFWNLGARMLLLPFFFVDASVKGFTSAELALSGTFLF